MHAAARRDRVPQHPHRGAGRVRRPAIGVHLHRDLAGHRRGLPAALSSFAITRLSASRSSRSGIPASIRSATSSADASSTFSRSGRAIDSASATVISPAS